MDQDNPEVKAESMNDGREDRFAWGSDTLLSQCLVCKHAPSGVLACKAFLGGIPDAIITNNFDHRKPWIDPTTGEAGDQGFDLEGSILFEPKPGINPITLSVLYRHLDGLAKS